MPVTHLIHPRTGNPLLFDEAPEILEEEGIMPAFAVRAIIDGLGTPSFNVRPSDVQPAMECRRQRVWKESHTYGVNPLDEEPALEGGLWHEALGALELEVPGEGERAEVCGVPMRGRVDWVDDDRVTDLKTTTPFWIARFPTKEQKAADPTLRPWAEVWEPKSSDDDIEKWQYQLSIYALLLARQTGTAPVKKGRVWRRYGGVKAEKGRYKRFDFPLLTEEELEAKVGPWIRTLSAGLKDAEAGNKDAWKAMPADGREMRGGGGRLWKCERCPLRVPCSEADGADWTF